MIFKLSCALLLPQIIDESLTFSSFQIIISHQSVSIHPSGASGAGVLMTLIKTVYMCVFQMINNGSFTKNPTSSAQKATQKSGSVYKCLHQDHFSPTWLAMTLWWWHDKKILASQDQGRWIATGYEDTPSEVH